MGGGGIMRLTWLRPTVCILLMLLSAALYPALNRHAHALQRGDSNAAFLQSVLFIIPVAHRHHDRIAEIRRTWGRTLGDRLVVFSDTANASLGIHNPGITPEREAAACEGARAACRARKPQSTPPDYCCYTAASAQVTGGGKRARTRAWRGHAGI